MTRTSMTGSITATVGLLLAASSAHAGAHTWRVNEVFSNADGSIQFIELKESAGTPGENFIAGLTVRSLATGNVFTFPGNLVQPTSNRHLLLATASFANLPGAPAPNYIIPQNFFSLSGDTLTYNNGIYDTWNIAAGAVPTDCVNSLHRTAFTPSNPGMVAPNSPTNYAGATGQVNACPAIVGDLNGDTVVNGLDLGILLINWSIPPGAPGCGGAKSCPSDLNGDGQVNGLDLGILLGNWTI
jgi:hypothetical protein